MLVEAQQNGQVQRRMNIHTPTSNAQACGEQLESKASKQPRTSIYQQLKLAMDVHAAIAGECGLSLRGFFCHDFIKR
jgi:hypothetical protein